MLKEEGNFHFIVLNVGILRYAYSSRFHTNAFKEKVKKRKNRVCFTKLHRQLDFMKTFRRKTISFSHQRSVCCSCTDFNYVPNVF